MFMPMNRWANGGTTEQTRNATNVQAKDRANE